MTNIDIVHLIPNFILGDKNGWATAKAIEKMMQIFYDKIQEGIDTALNPDKMPEWRLDELAREENIFWYDYGAEISDKREIIKNAGRIYSMLGTKSGAERAAQDFCDDARIEEWFEYGGQPAHFRIRTNTSDAAEKAGEIIRSVEEVKRLSAVLESIRIDHPAHRAELHAGLAIFSGCKLQFAMEDAAKTIEQSEWLVDEAETILLDEQSLVLLNEEG